MGKVLLIIAFAMMVAAIVLAIQGGYVAQDNDAMLYSNPEFGVNRRLYGVTEWKYFPISLWITGAGVSHLDPLIAPDLIPRLFLVRISAFTNGTGAPTGSTVISVDAHNGGVPTSLATLTLPQALASFTVVTTEVEVPILSTSNMVIMAVQTDGGHRSIFATAYFAQVPLRR